MNGPMTRKTCHFQSCRASTLGAHALSAAESSQPTPDQALKGPNFTEDIVGSEMASSPSPPKLNVPAGVTPKLVQDLEALQRQIWVLVNNHKVAGTTRFTGPTLCVPHASHMDLKS